MAVDTMQVRGKTGLQLLTVQISALARESRLWFRWRGAAPETAHASLKFAFDALAGGARDGPLVHEPKSSSESAKVALVFDGSVDAFHAYVAHREEVDAVIYIRDHLGDRPLEYREGRAIKSALGRAAGLGKPMVNVDTNLRQIMAQLGHAPDSPIVYDLLGLVLASDFSHLLVPHGPESPDRLQPLAADWSTLEALRVCWDNPDRSYNCGRCSKCTRTVAPARLIELLARESKSRARQLAELMEQMEQRN